MPIMESSSIALAQSYVKEAQKASKSSWLSKPEWDVAAPYWDRAANAFKTARRYEDAVTCFVKAAEAYVKVNSLYLAGEGYRNAAALTEKHLNDHTNTIGYYCRASDMFRTQGSAADKAAAMMENAARACEGIDSSRAIQLYESALAIYESEDRIRVGIPTFKRLTSYLIEKNRLSEAAELQTRLGEVCQQVNNRSELAKSCLSAIILVLAFGDLVEASKKRDQFGENMAFVRSKEGTVANAMVEAYADGDQDQFDVLAQDQVTTFLDGAVARLAARIRVPGARRTPPGAAAPDGDAHDARAGHATGGGAGGTAGDNDEDLL
ncbi:hypothetical protein LPJ61_001533 [Coemansia biformis]|uniref:Gamma-soluble NSF attachment protein n=1 Tax=Coemansia biformis TaxID=1286918 RepID=A0A9W8CZH9_9FUNG|nr:hypothetical protein LPJ61_001533 [Coemansia biformis]